MKMYAKMVDRLQRAYDSLRRTSSDRSVELGQDGSAACSRYVKLGVRATGSCGVRVSNRDAYELVFPRHARIRDSSCEIHEKYVKLFDDGGDVAA